MTISSGCSWLSFFREEGYQIVEADSSLEAIRLIDEAGPFHAVLTDIHIAGGVDGIDVAETARRRQPKITVIIVSGCAPETASRIGSTQPPPFFIQKPYPLQEVVSVLEGHRS